MLKLNRAIVTALLRNAGILKAVEQKGGQVVISRDPLMQCWDSDTSPSLHYGLVKGYVWQWVKGGEVIRKGYITHTGRVVEVITTKKGTELLGSLVKGASIISQKPLPYGGSWSSSEERIFRQLTLENFAPHDVDASLLG